MKSSFLVLAFIFSASAFAGDCTISLQKGANYRDINDRFIPFEEVEAELQRQAKGKGYTLVASGNAAIEARISSVVYMTNESAELRQIDVYTVDSKGYTVIDGYSRGTLLDRSPEKMVSSAIKKLIKKLPVCQ